MKNQNLTEFVRSFLLHFGRHKNATRDWKNRRREKNAFQEKAISCFWMNYRPVIIDVMMNKKEMTNLIIDKRNEGKEQPFIELSNRFFFQHFFFVSNAEFNGTGDVEKKISLEVRDYANMNWSWKLCNCIETDHFVMHNLCSSTKVSGNWQHCWNFYDQNEKINIFVENVLCIVYLFLTCKAILTR